MDDRRFDSIAKSFAAATPRRALLKAVAGAVLGAVAGALSPSSAPAAICRAPDEICRKNGDCCTNRCGPKDRTGRQRCACPPGQGACGSACLDPAAFLTDPDNCGACGVVCPRAACRVATCEAGACALTPLDCAGLTDQCNAGVCDPTTNGCVASPVEDETSCNADDDRCSENDVCRQGVCTAGAPKACPPTLNDCQINGACNPATGDCAYELAPAGTPCADDNALCVEGVCCANPCTIPGANGGLEQVCCGAGLTCVAIDPATLPDNAPELGVCCPAGSEACLESTIAGGADAVCCASGETCQAITVSDQTIAMCCVGAPCVTFTSGLPEFVCCGAGEACAPVTLSDEVEAGVCCPAGQSACVGTPAAAGDFDLVCCDNCQPPEGLEAPPQFCCPAGEYPVVTPVTFAITCRCSDPCISISSEPVCCVDDEVCAPFTVGGNTFGACCASGQSACLATPFLVTDADPDLVCCDNCQLLASGGLSVEFCCPTGQTPAVDEQTNTVNCA